MGALEGSRLGMPSRAQSKAGVAAKTPGTPAAGAACRQGMTRSGAGCVACGPYCRRCAAGNPAVCLDCYPGFTAVNGKCVHCQTPGCTSCVVDGAGGQRCTGCGDGLFFHPSNATCAPCNSPVGGWGRGGEGVCSLQLAASLFSHSRGMLGNRRCWWVPPAELALHVLALCRTVLTVARRGPAAATSAKPGA